MAQKKPFQRLPKEVTPVNYVLNLQPDLKTLTFQGNEDISVKINAETDSIVLNSVDIKISKASYSGNGQAFTDVGVTFDEPAETVKLTFSEKLKTGDGVLKLSFTGELNDKMKGFYRSKYTTAGGEEAYAAVTQFEATDARRAFPCWDEPAHKATFDVTLVVPKDKVALSNMPVIKEMPLESDDSWKVLQYDRTPIMSTYLLAFVVGEFDYVEARDADNVLIRVYTPVGKKEQGKFALDVAVQTLPFYNKYFNIPYPLPKLDLIAIANFAAGAMENWGLVTYRETALLIDAENSSAHARQWVALVVGHELAHQWFGNLVTMEWWTHLWLNEGFASWIEYLCVDKCFPEYDIWTQFASSDFTKALELDALDNSHPIEVPVGHPDEVDEIFDAISYSKGASVIRMLHDFIGDEDYKKGMHAYLTKHQFGNTFTEDLWAALGEACGKPIDTIMSTWTKQMGFPVLTVSQKIEGSKRILTISQKKFCVGKCADDKSKWLVPVTISTASSTTKPVHKFVLNERETTVTVDNVKEGDWLKLNTGGVGFYRTQYASDMLDMLIPAIRDGTLPPLDRLGLQNDLFALARVGVSSTVDVLKVAEAFSGETNFTVWQDLLSNMGSIKMMLQYTDSYDLFQKYMCKFLSSVGNKLGWEKKENEGHLDLMLRSLILGSLGSCGDKHVIEECKKRFGAHCKGNNVIQADLRAPVYGTVIKHGNEEMYEEMLKLLKKTDLQEEKVRIMARLGGSHKPALIDRTLQFSLSSEVRSQDFVFVISGVTSSVEGRDKAWKFLKDNWKELHDKYQGGFLLSRLIKVTTENFATAEKAKEVEEFFKQHPAPAGERTIQQSLENIRLNIKQLENNKDAIKAFLQSYNA